MDLIGLPGNNPETEPWLRELASRLMLGQTSNRICRYRHWDELCETDIQFEASQLRLLPEDVVVAKSMGTLVLLAHASLRGAPIFGLPERAVFIGIPYLQLPEPTLNSLQTFAANTPSLFIQQTEDFTGGFRGLETLLGTAPMATLVEVAGADHLYADTEALAGHIAIWWRALGSTSGERVDG